MQVHQLSSLDTAHGGTVTLDLCFGCQGMWIDPKENLRLAPAAVARLFTLLHEQRNTGRNPLAAKMNCPRCSTGLTEGFDLVRSGRYITYRCNRHHGRFSSFSSFMIEKGFVRQLTRAEIDEIARKVAVIHCSSCGAPVDLRRDHACAHCRSALSLLDPKAVETALAGYAKAHLATATSKVDEVANALVMLERDHQRALREKKEGSSMAGALDAGTDLLGIGVAMVWKLLAH
jgi:hypothetical protein